MCITRALITLLVIVVAWSPQAVLSEEKKVDGKYSRMLLEGLDELNALEKQLEPYVVAEKRLMRENYQACFNAFGDAAFCKCVETELRWPVNFDQYYFGTTRNKEAAGYSGMDDFGRQRYDHISTVREKCAGKNSP